MTCSAGSDGWNPNAASSDAAVPAKKLKYLKKPRMASCEPILITSAMRIRRAAGDDPDRRRRGVRSHTDRSRERHILGLGRGAPVPDDAVGTAFHVAAARIPPCDHARTDRVPRYPHDVRHQKSAESRPHKDADPDEHPERRRHEHDPRDAAHQRERK